MSNPMHLRPEEWKTMSLLNLAQVQDYISSIPGTLEGGSAGVQPEHLALVDQQFERVRTLLKAWQRSRFEVPTEIVAPPSTIATNNATNGSEPKRKGGWQKGRPRKPKPEQGAAQ